MALDEFDRIKVVGKGSYGEVWLVRHKKDRKQYVLKKMNLQRASKRERTSAEQEAKLLSKLKHPNIVSYKDSFETQEGSLYIAMQYCEGGDLYTRLKEQKGVLLVERQVVEWFVQIAMALQYMHERHILHRDLKTQNIFLTKSKIIKVGDLGIARVLDNCTDMATTLIGTPYYMSPELFSNKPYNHKSDVWALGCCVYEMATLKHAFNAKDMNSLVYKILKGRMPQIPKQYSPELNAIIKSLLNQDPDKRPSVNRILRDPFIKKNIAIFLEDTKKTCRRPSTASRPSSSSSSTRLGSASSSRSESQKSKISVSNVSSAKSEVDNVDSVSVVSVSSVQVAVGSGDVQQVPVQRKGHSRKPSDGVKQMEPIHEKQEDKGKGDSLQSSSSSTVTSQDTVVAVTVVNKEPEESQPQEKKERLKKRKFLRNKKSEQTEVSNKNKEVEVETEQPPPKPMVASAPHSLSELPKAEESRGLPQKREELVKNQIQKEERSDSSKSSTSSVSSSREEYPNFDLETPRSLPNISARERRRSKNPAAASLENPNSARIKLVKVPSDPLVNKQRKLSQGEPQKSKQMSKKAMRQPSMHDESSSDEESTSNSEKEKRRENKEINNFISLLDTTLHLNQKDDKSEDEEELIPIDNTNNRVNGTAEKSIPERSADSIASAYRVDCMPSVDTLCDSNRLMNRIRLLHTDCIKGVGYDIVRKACDILNNIEDDEIEPQLVALMGKEKFDEYAGKIWQLKFCEDSLYK